jgi:hypothetical protein
MENNNSGSNENKTGKAQGNARRAFLKVIGVSAAAIVAAPFLKVQEAFAAHVKPTDPLPSALKYVDNIDAMKTKPAAYKKGAHCGTCQFYSDTTGKAANANCSVLANAEVSNKGWCSSYTVRPKKA